MKHRLNEAINPEHTPNIHFHLDMIGIYDHHPDFPEPGVALTRQQALVVLHMTADFVGYDTDQTTLVPVPMSHATLASSFEMLAEASRLVANIECEIGWDHKALAIGDEAAELLRGPETPDYEWPLTVHDLISRLRKFPLRSTVLVYAGPIGYTENIAVQTYDENGDNETPADAFIEVRQPPVAEIDASPVVVEILEDHLDLELDAQSTKLLEWFKANPDDLDGLALEAERLWLESRSLVLNHPAVNGHDPKVVRQSFIETLRDWASR